MDERSAVLQTAMSANKVAILRAIAGEPCSVNDLCSRVGRPNPNVSQDLAVLRMRGFAASRSDGQRRIYSITREGRRVLALAGKAFV